MKYLGMALVLMAGTALNIGAQAPAGGRGRGGGGRGGPQFDQAAVDRGQKEFVATCSSCHGADARGGTALRGPDLIRSVVVLDDDNGKQIGDYLAGNHPMPRFSLSQGQVSDMATFLHRAIAVVVDRGSNQILNILVGDAKAGEAYFNGAGRCNTCHSPAGDFKGLGAKYDPVTLQGRVVMPAAGRGGRGGAGAAAPVGPVTTVKVTLPSGQTMSGALVRLTDFDVILRDSSGVSRSIARDGDVPKVEVTNPLQAHIDMLPKYKDADIHNLTAYLVTLK